MPEKQYTAQHLKQAISRAKTQLVEVIADDNDVADITDFDKLITALYSQLEGLSKVARGEKIDRKKIDHINGDLFCLELCDELSSRQMQIVRRDGLAKSLSDASKKLLEKFSDDRCCEKLYIDKPLGVEAYLELVGRVESQINHALGEIDLQQQESILMS